MEASKMSHPNISWYFLFPVIWLSSTIFIVTSSLTPAISNQTSAWVLTIISCPEADVILMVAGESLSPRFLAKESGAIEILAPVSIKQLTGLSLIKTLTIVWLDCSEFSEKSCDALASSDGCSPPALSMPKCRTLIIWRSISVGLGNFDTLGTQDASFLSIFIIGISSNLFSFLLVVSFFILKCLDFFWLFPS